MNTDKNYSTTNSTNDIDNDMFHLTHQARAQVG